MIMTNTIGTISIYENEIIITYNIGYSKTFKIKDSPKYLVGTQWIDYNGSRFFLTDEE